MKIEVGEIRTIGDALVAAVTRCEVEGHGMGGAVVSHGQKMPLAVLISRYDELKAFHLTGEDMPLDELERLCPEAPGAMMGGD